MLRKGKNKREKTREREKEEWRGRKKKKRISFILGVKRKKEQSDTFSDSFL